MRLNLNTRRLALLALALLVAPFSVSCGGDQGPPRPLIVATTGHIHDALLALTRGTEIELKLLCGPGVDPHSYGASTKDVLAMERATAIIYNGFHLEAQLGDVLARESLSTKAWAMASAFPIEERLDWSEDGAVDPSAPFDPHIWNHLPGWAACVGDLASYLAETFPHEAGIFAANGAGYRAEVMEAHEWAKAALATLPANRRLLVSGHDAFQYFAGQYGLETVAVLGVGNDPEADIKTMQSVADLVVERKVPVIFLESITNPKVTKALEEACRGRWEVTIASTPLYSDDLGDEPPVNTYLGAFRTNVETILGGLGA